ncbi:MAG: hypothetical protein IH614_02200 [Desulfuromonadales bacterium]|nr:hypothetical protein [Desulfuromonadales bacterium]
MGFLETLFGPKKVYPPLDPANPAAGHLANMHEQLEEISQKAKQPLEVIPGEGGGYVFIGKPPRNFGIAWVEDGAVVSFKTLTEERGVKPAQLQTLVEKLRTTYGANQDSPRFVAKVGDQEVIVTPSEKFREQVSEVIRATIR